MDQKRDINVQKSDELKKNETTEQPNNAQNLVEMPLTPEEIVSKLQDLVTFALENEKSELAPTVSFVEVYKELQEIQKSIQLLSDYQKETMHLLSDLATQEGVHISFDDTDLPEKDKKIISQLHSLTTICEAARDRLHSEIVQNPDVQHEVTKTIKDATSSEDKKQRRRKNKFRSLGQDGWMQM